MKFKFFNFNFSLTECSSDYKKINMGPCRIFDGTIIPAIYITTTIYYRNDLEMNAGNFSVFNCTFEFADGQTISYRGADGVLENNIWRYNNFTCVGQGDLFRLEGVRDKFICNVVHSNGPSVGFSPGAGRPSDRELGLPVGSEVRLNLFYDLKYILKK